MESEDQPAPTQDCDDKVALVEKVYSLHQEAMSSWLQLKMRAKCSTVVQETGDQKRSSVLQEEWEQGTIGARMRIYVSDSKTFKPKVTYA